MRTLALLAGAVLLGGCEKNAIQIDNITAPASGALVKFFNFSVNGPQVNFFAGTTKVTAISSTTGVESTVGVAYGSAGASGFYTAIPAGQVTFSGRISATADNGVAIASIPAQLADGKAYSVFLSGFYNTTAKSTEGFVVEDNFPSTFDYTAALVRFVNASSNSAPMQLVLRNTTTSTEAPVGATVAYKAGGAFVAVPAGGYDLITRTAGSSTNLITRTAVALSAGRVYTIAVRGDMTLPSTGTATNRPSLDVTANR
jgi:hypothetical protein